MTNVFNPKNLNYQKNLLLVSLYLIGFSLLPWMLACTGLITGHRNLSIEDSNRNLQPNAQTQPILTQTQPLDNLFGVPSSSTNFDIYGVRNDQIFKISGVPVQSTNNVTLHTLLSPNGWKFLYYTTEQSLGSYSINLIDLREGSSQTILNSSSGSGFLSPVWWDDSEGFGYLSTLPSNINPYYKGTLHNFDLKTQQSELVSHDNVIRLIGFTSNGTAFYVIEADAAGSLNLSILNLKSTSKIVFPIIANGFKFDNFDLARKGNSKILAFSAYQLTKPDSVDSIRIVNAETGAILQQFEAEGTVRELLLSPSGDYVTYTIDSLTTVKSNIENPLAANNGLWLHKVFSQDKGELFEKQKGNLQEQFKLASWGRDSLSLLFANALGLSKQLSLASSGKILNNIELLKAPVITTPHPLAIIKNLTVPYVHQNLDTPDGFDGAWACGPTSAVMTLAAYGKLVAHPMYVNYSGRWSDWGWYDSNIYTNNGTTFNQMQPDPRGRAAYGAYGWSVAPINGVCCGAWAWRVQDYMQKNGLSSTFSGSSSLNSVKAAIDAGKLVILSNSLTSSGHIVVVTGYTDDGRLVTNDPWGDKNQSGYGTKPNGNGAIYSWAQLGATWMITVDSPIPTLQPTGSFDSADCNTIWGWAWDPKAPNVSIDVHVYKDGPFGTGTLVIATTANIYRADVAAAVGDNGNHGFSIPLPNSLKDGINHTLYIHGINTLAGGLNSIIPGSPKTVNCTIGVGEGSNYQQNFVNTYNRLGGVSVVGQALDVVKQYGNTGVYWQPFGGGQLNTPGIFHHQAGSIAPQNIRAFLINGDIFTFYINMGGPGSWLGAPTSDIYDASSTATHDYRANFTNGYIAWNGSNYQAYNWPNNFSGWITTYYNNPDLASGPSLVRNEGNSATLDFSYSWNGAAPVPTQGANFPNQWSAKWVRSQSFNPGTYKFTLCGDDGVRLYLFGSRVIDQWQVQYYTCYDYIQVFASAIDIPVRIEYYQGEGGSGMAFSVTQLSTSLVVTVASDQGATLDSNTPGTLSYALAHATTGNTITFSGVSTINVTGILPPVQSGVTIDGGNCANPIVIDGYNSPLGTNGLVLSGNDIVKALKVQKFKGVQLKTIGTGNKLSCVKTSKN